VDGEFPDKLLELSAEKVNIAITERLRYDSRPKRPIDTTTILTQGVNHLAKNIDHWTRNINMRTKLLVIFYFVTLVPVGIISILFYQNSTKALEKEIGTTRVEMARQVENRLEWSKSSCGITTIKQ
jgi:hypothetical protein